MQIYIFAIIVNLTTSFPREQASTSSRLNAVDLYLVVCVFFVFGKSLGGEMIRHSVYVHHVHHVHHHYG